MLPKYVLDILATKFTEAEVQVINSNWDSYCQISLSNSSKGQLIKAGKMVLTCVLVDE